MNVESVDMIELVSVKIEEPLRLRGLELEEIFIGLAIGLKFEVEGEVSILVFTCKGTSSLISPNVMAWDKRFPFRSNLLLLLDCRASRPVRSGCSNPYNSTGVNWQSSLIGDE